MAPVCVRVWRHAPPLLAAALLTAGCGGSPTAPPPVPGTPTITCPADVTIGGVIGVSQAVMYQKPRVTGEALPLDSSCSPAQGATFPVGATVVNCSTSDSLGRRATCAFTVTLSPLVLGVTKLLAFGDSITRGEDGGPDGLRWSAIDPAAAYPAVLQSFFDRDFPTQGITVVGAGVSGEPVSCDPPPADPEATCGTDRLPGELAQHRPDVLLVLHGYNDLDGGLDAVDEVVAAIRDLVRTARGAGVQRVFVGTITPGRTPTGPNRRQRDPEAILQTNAALATMAPAEGAHLVDLFAAFAGRELELVADDGLHLTAAGSRVVAETFYSRVREVVPAQAFGNGGTAGRR